MSLPFLSDQLFVSGEYSSGDENSTRILPEFTGQVFGLAGRPLIHLVGRERKSLSIFAWAKGLFILTHQLIFSYTLRRLFAVRALVGVRLQSAVLGKVKEMIDVLEMQIYVDVNRFTGAVKGLLTRVATSMYAPLVFLMILILPTIFSQPAWGQGEKQKIPVFVSILPQAYFLDRIGGSHVDVEVLIRAGQSPHSYEPTPKQMAKLATAKAFFSIGVPVEKGVLRKIRQSHKQIVIVETQRGIVYRYLVGHDHNQGDSHDKSGNKEVHVNPAPGRAGQKTPDPHIWMAPKLVKIQARNICDALSRLDPAHKQEYESNLQAFDAELDRLDAGISRTLAPFKGRKMYVFHPSFGYFADAYGLIQVPIEIEGKEPGARELSRLIDRAKKDRVKVMFVQPQFSARSAEAAAQAIGGVVVAIDPLARDYPANLGRIAAAIERGSR